MAWTPAVKHLIQDLDDEEGLQHILKQLPSSIHQVTCTGSSTLHCCALNDKPKSVSLLLSEGVDVNFRNDYDETPLHWAVKSGAKQTCLLLIKNGADINASDSDGNTPLHWACENDDTEILNILLRSNNIDLNIENFDEMTPLEVATLNGYYHLVKLFLENRNTKISKKKLVQFAEQSENEKLIQLFELM